MFKNKLHHDDDEKIMDFFVAVENCYNIIQLNVSKDVYALRIDCLFDRLSLI